MSCPLVTICFRLLYSVAAQLIKSGWKELRTLSLAYPQLQAGPDHIGQYHVVPVPLPEI